MTKTAFVELLNHRKTLIIDGGLATRLEQRGNSVSGALWSGHVLYRQPEEVKAAHLDFFRCGADIAITASYQLSVPGVITTLGLAEEDAIEMFKQTVFLAQAARQEASALGVPGASSALVAGSVGPYGAYLADGSEYRGRYNISSTALKDFHRPRIRALTEAGADLLALETIPSFEEITALLELLVEEFPDTIAWLSCTLADAHHIADGTSLEKVLSFVNASKAHVVVFGANCISPALMDNFLRHAGLLTSKPLLCYPNSGEIWDAERKIWLGAAASEVNLARAGQDWSRAGAKLIGGCCRTTPDDIHALATALKRGS